MTEAPDLAPSPPDLVWQATIGAALARQGRGVARASLAVGIAAIGLGVVLVRLEGPSATGVFAAISMVQAVLLAIGIHLGLRVGFDAELFAALAARADVAGFDRAMTDLGLMPPAKAGRAMAARIAGMKRLLMGQGVGLGAQLVALLVLGLVGGGR